VFHVEHANTDQHIHREQTMNPPETHDNPTEVYPMASRGIRYALHYGNPELPGAMRPPGSGIVHYREKARGMGAFNAARVDGYYPWAVLWDRETCIARYPVPSSPTGFWEK
jgi:hypothetical protein